MSFTQNVADWIRYPKQVREAAHQMWGAVQRGYTFEVPLSLDKHDPAMSAVYLMQKMHPEVRIGVRQSRSLIVSHESRHNISAGVKELLMKGGQMYSPEQFTGSIEAMLAGHESFLRDQNLDPALMAREAKEAEMKEHAMVVGAQGSEVLAPVLLDASGNLPAALATELPAVSDEDLTTAALADTAAKP